MIELNRDVLDVDPAFEQAFTPLPDGWYTVQIDDVEMRDSKAGHQYLNLRFSVTSGDYVGRKLFNGFNIGETYSSTVQDCAWRDFDLMATAVKKRRVGDGDELLGLILDVKLTTKQDKGYDPRNKISQYRSSADGDKTPPPIAAAVANGGAAPWLKTA